MPAGSTPAPGTCEEEKHHGAVRKPVKRRSSNLRDSAGSTPACATLKCESKRPSTQTLAKRPGREPGDFAGSTPASATGPDSVVEPHETLRRSKAWFDTGSGHVRL